MPIQLCLYSITSIMVSSYQNSQSTKNRHITNNWILKIPHTVNQKMDFNSVELS